jgi:ferritin-like metal-binding protein YciE
MLGKDPKSQTCDAMKGLISEGGDDIDESPLRDARIIAAANARSIYEIAAYGSPRTFAEILSMNDEATLLDETLQEEKMADQKLTQLAESMVNEESLRTPVSQR